MEFPSRLSLKLQARLGIIYGVTSESRERFSLHALNKAKNTLRYGANEVFKGKVINCEDGSASEGFTVSEYYHPSLIEGVKRERDRVTTARAHAQICWEILQERVKTFEQKLAESTPKKQLL